MLEEKLHIKIITYNRGPALARTLEALRQSPFADCPLTVFDNCSTDETPEVCARYQTKFLALQILRHPKNIGLSANYLRAVESSTSLYTWILCDDDQYDWKSCDDVLQTIENGEVDCICVGLLAPPQWERGLKISAQELWKRGSAFFWNYTFVPGLIFKTARFDSDCIFRGYYNAANVYPHVPFILKILRDDLSQYISRHALVIRNEENGAFSGLHWLTMLFNSAALAPEAHVRRRLIYEVAPSRSQWLRVILRTLVYAKLDSPQKSALVPRQYLQLLLACEGEQQQRMLLLAPLALAPRSWFLALQTTWKRLKPNHVDTPNQAANMAVDDSDAFRG